MRASYARHGGEVRPLWAKVGLSALFTLCLVAFGGAAAFVGDVLTESAWGARLFVVLAVLVVVGFLVHYAYPPPARRWYHWAGFELAVLVGFTLPIPLVYLPWRIVSQRA